MSLSMLSQDKYYSSHCQECVNRTSPFAANEKWINVTETCLYYAYPTITIFGIVSGFISICVLSRNITNSNDIYLMGLTIANFFLVICGGYLWLPQYIGYYDLYQRMLAYFTASNDWFWYVTLWILMVMCLERCLTLTQNRRGNMCSQVQTLISVVLIYGMCLLSALPRLWEVKLQEISIGKNETVLIPRQSPISRTQEYSIMYFWYKTTITIFLPLPILLVLICLLATATSGLRETRRRLAPCTMDTSCNTIIYKTAEEDITITWLFVAIIIFYLLLTTPKVMVDLLPKITMRVLDTSTKFYHILHDLTQTLFYFNYSVTFFLYLRYHLSFRQRLGGCLTCNRQDTYKITSTHC